VVVPRLVIRLIRAGGWRGTEVVLPDGEWRNELTGQRVDGGAVGVAALLGRFPAALMTREGHG
jgi:(1->4)-alpha-D-glucan 1-alpha-D-glucosylmutase